MYLICHGIEKSELTRIKTRGMICLLQNHHSSHKRVRTQWHRNPSHTTVYIHMYTYICMCTMCIYMYMYTEVQTCTLTRICTILYSQVDKPLICSTYIQHTQHDNEDVLIINVEAIHFYTHIYKHRCLPSVLPLHNSVDEYPLILIQPLSSLVH